MIPPLDGWRTLGLDTAGPGGVPSNALAGILLPPLRPAGRQPAERLSQGTASAIRSGGRSLRPPDTPSHDSAAMPVMMAAWVANSFMAERPRGAASRTAQLASTADRS